MTQYKHYYEGGSFAAINQKIRNYWETPDWLFDLLHEIFNFTVDAAAHNENKKLDRYWGEDDNSLSFTWEGECVFCNPPTSDGEYGKWLDHAADQFYNHGVTTAMVVPFKWETSGFRPVRKTAKYLLLPPNRVRFDPPEGIEGKSPTFYSCVAVFTWEKFSTADLIKLTNWGFTVMDLTKGIIAGR